MYADAGDPVAAALDLARVHADPDRQPHALEILAHLERAAHGAGRAVEAREQPVAGEVGDDAAKPRDVLAARVLEGLEQLPPLRVAQLDRALRGGDDVGEQHRRQHAVAVVDVRARP